MSDEDQGAEEPKLNRLSGFVAPKGGASRPSPEPRPASENVPSSSSPPVGLGSKSLTLRLPEAEYERLRAHAFSTRQTHQTILAAALKAYLDVAK
jgi:hypothetical protein